MRWEMLSGSLWILRSGKQNVAAVSLMTATGGFNAQLLPPREGAVVGTFPTLERAQAAVEERIKREAKQKGREAA